VCKHGTYVIKPATQSQSSEFRALLGEQRNGVDCLKVDERALRMQVRPWEWKAGHELAEGATTGVSRVRPASPIVANGTNIGLRKMAEAAGLSDGN
jgi:hypothetical protein